MLEVRYYFADDGASPFADWFAEVGCGGPRQDHGRDARMGQGNLSNVKSVGGGVLEYKIDFGPGYRVYFGRDGDVLIVLLTGGTKKRQQRDIKSAIAFWADYKATKRGLR
jgi:putative addiction module killer protein